MMCRGPSPGPGMINRGNGWVIAALVLSFGAVAQGQVDLGRFQRQLEQIRRDTRLLVRKDVPADQRARIDYGGYINFSFLSIDDTDQSTHILRQTTLVGYADVSFDGVHEFFVRGRSTYSDWNAGDSFDEHDDDWVEPTLDRAHYRFDLKRSIEANEGRTIDGNLVIQGGRQLVNWVNGLTLSQEIDGGQVTVSLGPWTLQTVAGVTRNSSTDLDSSRPDYSDDTDRQFYGGILSYKLSPKHQPYVYGLVQEDHNDSGPFLVSGVPTEFEYNSHYIGAGSTGSIGDRLLYGVELVYQGGEGLSNSFDAGTLAIVPQNHEGIRAYAADVRLDYLFADANRTRLSGELILATGDADRVTTTNTLGGNKSGTTDRAFNAFGLLNTGLAFNPAVSNLLMVRVGASTFPTPQSTLFSRLQVGTNLFIYNKLKSSAPIDEDTLTEPTDDTHYIGFEADFFANWQMTSDTALTMRYGVFFPGDGIGTDHDTRHFFFTGVTVAF